MEAQRTITRVDDPTTPSARADLGVPDALVLDIALRRALFDGETSTLRLAEALAVSPSLMDEIVEELRRLRYLEVHGLEGRGYLLSLTELGYQHALERMQLCRYAGPVPVPLEDYRAIVEAQHQRPSVDRGRLRACFDDLVVSDALLDELGPAIRASGAMFLYGPPGTGKSSIAERLVRVFDDTVLVPHAVEVDGQVITVFDPVTHRTVDDQPPHLDRRWVRCHRPSVIVGGELTQAALELTYDPHSGVYLASLQMQANNGVLVIDDFGRQRITPEEMLNRWLVPLDRGIDYLSLDYGVSFEVPCLEKIVFCTNLPPESLADEAFYRRIRGKVNVPPIDDEMFDEVLRRVSAEVGVKVTDDAPERLRQITRSDGDGDLRPYLPAAVCDLAIAVADYEGTEPVLDATTVGRVASLYFTHDHAMRGEVIPPAGA